MIAKQEDGIFLENVDGEQLEYLISWLQYMDDAENNKMKDFPKEIDKLLELYKVADFYDMPRIKDQILEEVAKNQNFLRYTNVRRFVFEFLDEAMTV